MTFNGRQFHGNGDFVSVVPFPGEGHITVLIPTVYGNLTGRNRKLPGPLGDPHRNGEFTWLGKMNRNFSPFQGRLPRWRTVTLGIPAISP